MGLAVVAPGDVARDRAGRAGQVSVVPGVIEIVVFTVRVKRQADRAAGSGEVARAQSRVRLVVRGIQVDSD